MTSDVPMEATGGQEKAEQDEDSDSSGPDLHAEINDVLNVSQESDRLDPEIKAAHEAPTLPVGRTPADTKKQQEDDGARRPWRRKAVAALLWPGRGSHGRYVSLALVPLVLWLSCLATFGSVAQPPSGSVFLLISLVVLAILAGKCFQMIRLPPLLGMLLAGIVIKNIPGLVFQTDWKLWSSTLRGTALVIILMRAGLGLDPDALKRLSGMRKNPKTA